MVTLAVVDFHSTTWNNTAGSNGAFANASNQPGLLLLFSIKMVLFKLHFIDFFLFSFFQTKTKYKSLLFFIDLWGFTSESGNCPGNLAVPPIFTDVVSCASECRQLANCSGFTYDYEGDVCYLKSQLCTSTMPSEMLAIEAWVKYYRKDFWVPAALERPRKHLDGDDPAAASEMMRNLLAMDNVNVSNPLEMVFFDNHHHNEGGQVDMSPPPFASSSSVSSVMSENDPWEAYANPSDGAEYAAISQNDAKVLIHRATINNATEASCRKACSIDTHCSFFYLLRQEITKVVNGHHILYDNNNNNDNITTSSKSNSSQVGNADDQGDDATDGVRTKWTSETVVTLDCILFSKWNASASALPKRRGAHDGKLFEKKSTAQSGGGNGDEVNSWENVNSDRHLATSIVKPSAHHVTLVSLKKRKRHIVDADHRPLASSSTRLPTSRTTRLVMAGVTVAMSVTRVMMAAAGVTPGQ